MSEVMNKIFTFFKNLFGSDIKTTIEKNNKYNINKNKHCNINISEKGAKGKNEKNK